MLLKLDTSKFNQSRNLSHQQEMFILRSGQYQSEWSANSGRISSASITKHSSIFAKVTVNDAVSGVEYTGRAQLGLRGFGDSEGASHWALSQSLTCAGQPSSRWGGRCSFALQWCTNISTSAPLSTPGSPSGSRTYGITWAALGAE